MKNKTNSWPKTLGLSLALAAGLAASASAVPITGAITFDGGATLNSASVNTATQVTSWVSPKVQSRDGSFTSFTAVGNPVAIMSPWNFVSGAIANFWQVGGFTFNLTSSSVAAQGAGFVNVIGGGFVVGNGFDSTPATWRFTAQDPSAGTPAVFSISASTGATAPRVPDGGSSVALLGFALTGMAFVSRKKKAI